MTKSHLFRRLVRLQTRLHCLHSLRGNATRAPDDSIQRPLRQRLHPRVLPMLLMALTVWQSPGHARGLQAEEQHVAAALASQVPWTPTAGKRLSHPLGVQTLFIEKQESKKASAERRARVFQYDYTSRSARVLTIDLDRQTLLRTQAIDSVHLPLSEQEIAFARNQLAQDDTLLLQLRAEQSLRNATVFQDLSELDVKASIYEPMDSNDPCASSRCALLSLFDATSTVFATEPLIHLDTQQVSELHRR